MLEELVDSFSNPQAHQVAELCRSRLDAMPGKKLRPGWTVEVVEEFKSDDTENLVLRKDLQGVIVEIDDGDAVVDFGLDVEVWVLAKHFDKLKIIKKEECTQDIL